MAKHHFYTNGKKDSGWGQVSAYMYRDGEKVDVDLGRYAKMWLGRDGRPSKTNTGHGVCTMREIMTDFPWQQVWDESGNNLRVYRYIIDGNDVPFIFYCAGWKGGDISLVDGIV